MEVIGFADDLAAVVVARTRDEVRTRVDDTLKKIGKWMETNKLSLVPEKTGIVILNGPRARRHFKFNLNGADVTPTKHVKYLGVMISENFYMSQHVQDAVEKTGKRLRSISALMPNMKGPSFHKRRLFYGVLKSTLMYAAPIWGSMVKMDVSKNGRKRSAKSPHPHYLGIPDNFNSGLASHSRHSSHRHRNIGTGSSAK